MSFTRTLFAMNVYFIRAMINGVSCVKVGKSRNPHSRLRGFQTGSPVKLELLDAIRCKSDQHALRVESYAHRLLKAYRQDGEWFAIADEWPATVELISKGADQIGTDLGYDSEPVVIRENLEDSDMDLSGKDYFTVEQAAEYACISFSHWRAKVQPEFPPGEFKGKLVYRRADVMRYVEENTKWPAIAENGP